IPFDRTLAGTVGGRMIDLGATVHGEAPARAAETERYDFGDESFAQRAIADALIGRPWTAEDLVATMGIPLEQAEVAMRFYELAALGLKHGFPDDRLIKGGTPGEGALEQALRQRLQDRLARTRLVTPHDAVLALGSKLPGYLDVLQDFML